MNSCQFLQNFACPSLQIEVELFLRNEPHGQVPLMSITVENIALGVRVTISCLSLSRMLHITNFPSCKTIRQITHLI